MQNKIIKNIVIAMSLALGTTSGQAFEYKSIKIEKPHSGRPTATVPFVMSDEKNRTAEGSSYSLDLAMLNYKLQVEIMQRRSDERLGQSPSPHYFPELTTNDLIEALKKLDAMSEQTTSIKGPRYYKFFWSENDYVDNAKIDLNQGQGLLFGYRKVDAANTPFSKAELCQNYRNKAQLEMIESVENQLSFTNEGGVFNKGVCWWHSSLTRASSYLAYFSPNKSKPSIAEVRNILKRLSTYSEVVEIPGYENLYEFSKDFKGEIISHLESMQWSEIRNIESRGLSGSSSSAADMRAQIERAYTDVTLHKDPVYMMLQIPGVDAHAWIIYDVKKTDVGYDLYVIDSNYELNTIWRYKHGMKNFNLLTQSGAIPFVPYVNSREKAQLAQMKTTLNRLCYAK